jgi:hypothetical protein
MRLPVTRLRTRLLVALAYGVLGGGIAHAEETSRSTPSAPNEILRSTPPDFRLRSATLSLTGYSQSGNGYQSQAGPRLGPGSERVTVFEPQLVVVIDQGEKLTHTLAVPVDIVTAASANAIDTTRKPDAISNASRQNQAAAIDWTAAYALDARTHIASKSGLHVEENYRSFRFGIGGDRSFADDATTVAANANQAFDWFDRLDPTGFRHGRATRGTSNANVALTQVVTATTVAHVNYGLTRQDGELGNTWNSVPLTDLTRGREILPRERVRHALVGRVAQFLPWNGALKGSYRFYADDWGIVAHSVEGQLLQRLTSWWYLRAVYRVHWQQGASFFTMLAASDDERQRTADSDLAPLTSQTIGGQVVFDVPVSAEAKLHLIAGYEEYFRSNDLRVHLVTCASGFRF